jgi:hypothetical protein
MMLPQYQVVLVSEDEMWQIVNNPPTLPNDVPAFCCVKRDGDVQFFPAFDAAKFDLICTRRK